MCGGNKVCPKVSLFTCNPFDVVNSIPQLVEDKHVTLKITAKISLDKFKSYMNKALNAKESKEEKEEKMISGWVESHISVYQSVCDRISAEFLDTGKVGMIEYNESSKIFFMHRTQFPLEWRTQVGLEVKNIQKFSNPSLYFIIYHRPYRLQHMVNSIAPEVIPLLNDQGVKVSLELKTFEAFNRGQSTMNDKYSGEVSPTLTQDLLDYTDENDVGYPGGGDEQWGEGTTMPSSPAEKERFPIRRVENAETKRNTDIVNQETPFNRKRNHEELNQASQPFKDPRGNAKPPLRVPGLHSEDPRKKLKVERDGGTRLTDNEEIMRKVFNNEGGVMSANYQEDDVFKKLMEMDNEQIMSFARDLDQPTREYIINGLKKIEVQRAAAKEQASMQRVEKPFDSTLPVAVKTSIPQGDDIRMNIESSNSQPLPGYPTDQQKPMHEQMAIESTPIYRVSSLTLNNRPYPHEEFRPNTAINTNVQPPPPTQSTEQRYPESQEREMMLHSVYRPLDYIQDIYNLFTPRELEEAGQRALAEKTKLPEVRLAGLFQDRINAIQSAKSSPARQITRNNDEAKSPKTPQNGFKSTPGSPVNKKLPKLQPKGNSASNTPQSKFNPLSAPLVPLPNTNNRTTGMDLERVTSKSFKSSRQLLIESPLPTMHKSTPTGPSQLILGPTIHQGKIIPEPMAESIPETKLDLNLKSTSQPLHPTISQSAMQPESHSLPEQPTTQKSEGVMIPETNPTENARGFESPKSRRIGPNGEEKKIECRQSTPDWPKSMSYINRSSPNISDITISIPFGNNSYMNSNKAENAVNISFTAESNHSNFGDDVYVPSSEEKMSSIDEMLLDNNLNPEGISTVDTQAYKMSVESRINLEDSNLITSQNPPLSPATHPHTSLKAMTPNLEPKQSTPSKLITSQIQPFTLGPNTAPQSSITKVDTTTSIKSAMLTIPTRANPPLKPSEPISENAKSFDLSKHTIEESPKPSSLNKVKDVVNKPLFANNKPNLPTPQQPTINNTAATTASNTVTKPTVSIPKGVVITGNSITLPKNLLETLSSMKSSGANKNLLPIFAKNPNPNQSVPQTPSKPGQTLQPIRPLQAHQTPQLQQALKAPQSVAKIAQNPKTPTKEIQKKAPEPNTKPASTPIDSKQAMLASNTLVLQRLQQQLGQQGAGKQPLIANLQSLLSNQLLALAKNNQGVAPKKQ